MAPSPVTTTRRVLKTGYLPVSQRYVDARDVLSRRTVRQYVTELQPTVARIGIHAQVANLCGCKSFLPDIAELVPR